MSESSEEHGFGLKEDWESVEKTLREVIPVYDKTNRYISLGTDLRIRRKGLELLRSRVGRDSLSILDLGSGPGKMTQMLLSMDKKRTTNISLMVDALGPMMLVAKSRNPNSDGLLAVYENLPLREESFDAAMAGFALRDAKSLHVALRQIRSSLKKGGTFLIVDLCKPDSKIKKALVGFYWKALAPIVAFLASGKLGLKFAALFTTYQRLPPNRRFLEIARECGFVVSVAEYSMLDGACILLLEKP